MKPSSRTSPTTLSRLSAPEEPNLLTAGRRAALAAVFLFFALPALCLSLVILSLPALAQSAASLVFLPTFWDPQHRLEKPDLVGIHSLRFLTEDDFPPFNFTAKDGSLVGFNVDLARALCEELKVTCTIQARRWDMLISSLDDGAGDALIASMKINAGAREKLDFTVPYFKLPARFAVLAKSPLNDISPDGLAEKVLGVEEKSAHEAFLRNFFGRAKIKTFANQDAARAALKAGEIDALFADGVTTSQWLNSPDGQAFAFRGGAYLESRFFGEGIGIGVKKGNVALRHALDYALAALAEKGIYDDLYLKYFPVGIY